jgi:hypothetical protein
LSNSASHPFCIATIVTHKAIEAMLEGSGTGSYRDEHPWLIAQDILHNATTAGESLPILFAVTDDNHQAYFSHWSVIQNIDVVELHRGQWDSRCSFDTLHPFNPIFEAIDSVFVKASHEQMAREEKEGIRVFRQALDVHHIHPYAICETPVFITEALAQSDQ